jgi:hypothetical protein
MTKGTGAAAALLILLVVASFAVFGGCLITAVIIHYHAGTVALPDRDLSYVLNRSNRIWESERGNSTQDLLKSRSRQY